MNNKPTEPDSNVWQPLIPREQRFVVLGALLLVMLLAALDSTIVSTALPRIATALNGLTHYSWVATAYLLASTVTIPLYGKLSDILGRKRVLLFGVATFLIGSVCCGAAQTMDQLIFARGLQGIGAGGLLPMVFASMGDMFSPRERGRYQGITGAVFGISSIVGPLLGGWITDHASWRFVFFVNLPVGVLAALGLILLMPNVKSKKESVGIDWLGAGLLVTGLTSLLLGLDWATAAASFTSFSVLTLLLGSLGLLGLFAWQEFRAPSPVMEPKLIANPIMAVSIGVCVLLSATMLGTIFYIPLFIQMVLQKSATMSGNAMMPLTLAWTSASVLSGQLLSRTGRYRRNAIAGAFMVMIASLLLLRLGLDSSLGYIILATVIAGLGLGIGMSIYTTIVQNAVPASKMGEASSTLTLFRQLGSTLGLAIMGSIISAQVTVNAGGQIDAATRAAFASALHNVYICVFFFSLAATVLVFFLKEIPLKDRADGDQPPASH